MQTETDQIKQCRAYIIFVANQEQNKMNATVFCIHLPIKCCFFMVTCCCIGRGSALLGYDWLVHYNDNVTEQDIMSWCRHHASALESRHERTRLHVGTVLIELGVDRT